MLLRSLDELVNSPTIGIAIKILGSVGSVVFGIKALGTKARDDDGKLTRPGKIAFVGILVSAAIASSSSLYDFASANSKDQAAKEQTDRLRLSVQRGYYPLRGATVDFTVALNKDFDGLDEYKKTIKKAFSLDPQCKKTVQFICDTDDPDEPKDYNYTIPKNSSLFPQSKSAFRKTIDSLSIEVLMLRAIPQLGKMPKYERLGSFNIELGSEVPKEWQLEYDEDSKSLFLNVRDYQIPEKETKSAKVFSLVDFTPGAIAVGNSIFNPYTTHTNWSVDEVLSFIKSLSTGLDVRSLKLSFSSPRAFEFYRYSSPLDDGEVAAIPCHSGDGDFLVLKTPSDIEQRNRLASIPRLYRKQR